MSKQSSLTFATRLSDSQLSAKRIDQIDNLLVRQIVDRVNKEERLPIGHCFPDFSEGMSQPNPTLLSQD